MKVTFRELFYIMRHRNDYKLLLLFDMSEFAKKFGYKNFREIRDIETLMNLEVETNWHRECRNEILLGLLRGEMARASKITFTPTDNGEWKVDIEKKPRDHFIYKPSPRYKAGEMWEGCRNAHVDDR